MCHVQVSALLTVKEARFTRRPASATGKAEIVQGTALGHQKSKSRLNDSPHGPRGSSQMVLGQENNLGGSKGACSHQNLFGSQCTSPRGSSSREQSEGHFLKWFSCRGSFEEWSPRWSTASNLPYICGPKQKSALETLYKESFPRPVKCTNISK